tara:strand:+ start:26096 stop:27712 length:1617 start_codon:yes stop_codon:yes gene_type:complete
MFSFKNLSNSFRKFIQLSSQVLVKKKKIKIFSSIILKNLNAFFEVMIVVLISYILTDELPDSAIVEYINFDSVSKLLPLIVLIRLGSNYLDHIVIEKLHMDVTVSQKKMAATKLFQKENLSFAYINYKVSAESGAIASLYKIFVSFIGTGLQLGVFAVSIMILNYKMGLIIFISYLLLLKPISFLLQKFKTNSELNKQHVIDLDRTLERILNNYYLIKIVKKEKAELDRFSDSLDNMFRVGLQNTRLFFVSHNILTSTATLIITILLVQNLFEVKLTLEIIFLLIRSVQFVSQMTAIYANLVSQNVFINSYLDELNKKEFKKDGQIHIQTKRDSKNLIELKNISFQYENSSELLFDNIKFNLVSGTHNLITGPNGSGKSTLIGIMSGIYKPSKGDVLINTDRFAYVGPDPLIFSDTLRNNLIYALDEAIDDSLLLEKLEKFKIFESEEEKNLDRLVSSKTLSSGQMQKISCIRSLVRNPDILFLDEATANLDKDSVKILNNELINFKGTILNITHKQEHFSNIDSIYIINAKNLIKSE